MSELTLDTRFDCAPLRANLTIGHCIQQQRLPAPHSPCQDCPVGRHHRALLDPTRPHPVSLPAAEPGRCHVCLELPYALGLCRPHFRQLERHGHLTLPGTGCNACGAVPARGNGLCLRCERKRPGARIQPPRTWLEGDRVNVDGTIYYVHEVRLWGSALVLGASLEAVILQSPAGLLIAAPLATRSA